MKPSALRSPRRVAGTHLTIPFWVGAANRGVGPRPDSLGRAEGRSARLFGGEGARGLAGNERGAVYIEYLLACIPVVAFFVATWQFIDLAAADLVLRRAASAAARAAVVVLPDDPHFYDDVAVDRFEGKRREDIELAAAMILGTMCIPNVLAVRSQFRGFEVRVGGPDGSSAELEMWAPLTATVTATFECGLGWASIVCGGSERELTAKATYAYQGAKYRYEP